MRVFKTLNRSNKDVDKFCKTITSEMCPVLCRDDKFFISNFAICVGRSVHSFLPHLHECTREMSGTSRGNAITKFELGDVQLRAKLMTAAILEALTPVLSFQGKRRLFSSRGEFASQFSFRNSTDENSE